MQTGCCTAPVHLYAGEEGVAAGVCGVLNHNDYITSTHRGHGHFDRKGRRPEADDGRAFRQGNGLLQRQRRLDASAIWSSVSWARMVLGAGLPIAVGAGYACKTFGKGQVCACFFGDGASNRGTFHESLNLAAAWKLPVIYALENNFYGISGSQRELTTLADLSERAKAYAMPGVTVEGNDIMAVIDATDEAVEQRKKGRRPNADGV